MPRDKKTEARIDSALPLLSAQEEALVQAWAAGHDQVTCYRMAYGAEGYGLPALQVKACRKFAEHKIHAHMRTLQAHGLAKLGLSREDRIRARLAFAQRAEDAGNYGAANGAHDAIDSLLGLKTERVEITTHDPDATLKEIAAEFGQDVAAMVARRASVDFDTSDTTKH